MQDICRVFDSHDGLEGEVLPLQSKGAGAWQDKELHIVKMRMDKKTIFSGDLKAIEPLLCRLWTVARGIHDGDDCSRGCVRPHHRAIVHFWMVLGDFYDPWITLDGTRLSLYSTHMHERRRCQPAGQIVSILVLRISPIQNFVGSPLTPLFYPTDKWALVKPYND